MSLNRWDYIVKNSINIKTAITQVDDNIAEGIKNNKSTGNAISVAKVSWPSGKVEVTKNDFSKNIAQKIEDMKHGMVDAAINTVGTTIALSIATPINLLLKTINVTLELMELAFQTFNSTSSVGLTALDAVDIFDLTNQAFEKAKDKVNLANKSFKNYSDSIQENIRVLTSNSG